MIIGPITLEAKVHIANADGTAIGAATCTLPPGQVPTLEALHRAIGQTLEAMPDGYRLAEPDEFFNAVVVKEMTGRRGNFAVPGDFRYDAVAVAAAGTAAYVPKPKSDNTADDDEDSDWDEDDDDI